MCLQGMQMVQSRNGISILAIVFSKLKSSHRKRKILNHASYGRSDCSMAISSVETQKVKFVFGIKRLVLCIRSSLNFRLMLWL